MYSERKRGFPRINLKREANFQLLRHSPQGDNLTLKAMVKNISISGIYIETKENISPPKISDIVWLEFNLAKEEKVKLMAEVRRIIRQENGLIGIGLMFINLPANVKKALWELVNKENSTS